MRTCHAIATGMLAMIGCLSIVAPGDPPARQYSCDPPATQPSTDPPADAVPATVPSPAEPADPDARALLDELQNNQGWRGRRNIGYDADGKIVSITLDRRSATDANVRALALFPDLTQVQIASGWNGTISPDALGELGRLKHLERLELRRFDSEITLDYAMALGKMTTLRSLSIMGSEIHTPAISLLAALPKLDTLELPSCDSLTDADFGALIQLTGLEELDLTYTTVGDDNLDALAHLQKLKVLWVPNTRVTKEGVQGSKLFGKVRVLGAKAKKVEKVS